MPVSSLCSKNVVTIDKGLTIQAATDLMKKQNIGSLVVTDGNGRQKPIGILTDRDIALNVFTKGLTADTPVEQIMSNEIVSISGDAGIAETVYKMESSGVRRIVVQDRNDKICGLVSSDDILQLLAKELSGIGRLVEKQNEMQSGVNKSEYRR